MINERTTPKSTAEDSASMAAEAEVEAVEREGFSLGKALRKPRTIISFVLAAAIIAFLFRGLDNPQDAWKYMLAANGWLLFLGMGLFYLSFPVRAVRWRMLLENADVPLDEGRSTWASLPALMEYMFLSWFVNCIVPAKLGDAYRGYLLKRNGGVSFSATFGTIFAERLLDMLGLFTFLVLSGWVAFGTHLPPATNVIFIAGIALVIVIIAGLAGMRLFSPFIRRLVPKRMEEKYSSFEVAALRSFRPTLLPRLMALTGLVWVLEGMRLYCVILSLHAVGLHISLPVVIFVALASSLLTVVPATPGGLGVVEGGVTAVLLALPAAVTSMPIERSLALAVTLLDRSINFWSIILIGAVVYLFSKRR